MSPSELHPEATERRQGWNHVFILAGLILLAAALRFYKIGEWGLDSDEVFM